MKTVSKFFGLIALCAAAFASCQKEQVFEEDQLSDAVEEEGTRAVGTKKSITLMTYNVCAFSLYETKYPDIKNKKSIFTDIASVIDDSGASYVSLNEVDWLNIHRVNVDQKSSNPKGYLKLIHNINQIDALVSRSTNNWYYRYFGTVSYNGGNDGYVGNGILSKMRVIKKDGKDCCKRVSLALDTPIYVDQSTGHVEANRGLLIIETEDCVFASTHLGLTKAAMEKQVEKINAHFVNYYSDCDKPVFLCGDFNATPTQMKTLMPEKDWQRISKTDIITKNPNCIDYILCWKGNKKAPVVKCTESYVIKDKKDGKYLMSDHYPVCAKVEWVTKK